MHIAYVVTHLRFRSGRYPMEMHIVCQNTKYKDMTEATQRPDGLAVLAVWFEVGTARCRSDV